MNDTGVSTSRRCLLAAAVVGVFLALAVSVGADPAGPTDGLARLKAGNARFVADASEALPITAPRRSALAQGQSPFASVLSCADSRVPPEVIFHQGLGDLFVVRAAGHVPDKSVLASLEYGAEHLHIPMLVVMGHEMCGAVKAAIETPAGTSLGPNLDYLIKSIRPAAVRAANQPAENRLRIAILENVEESINTLMEQSQLLRHLAETQKLTVVGGYYELASGRVHFSQPVGVPPSRVTQTPARPAHAPAARPVAASATVPAPVAKPAVPAASAADRGAAVAAAIAKATGDPSKVTAMPAAKPAHTTPPAATAAATAAPAAGHGTAAKPAAAPGPATAHDAKPPAKAH